MCGNCAATILCHHGTDNSIGLYHKLHGVTRPVTMKKSTIKRRKRVVPAAPDQPGSDQHSPRSYEPSASPEPSPSSALLADPFPASPRAPVAPSLATLDAALAAAPPFPHGLSSPGWHPAAPHPHRSPPPHDLAQYRTSSPPIPRPPDHHRLSPFPPAVPPIQTLPPPRSVASTSDPSHHSGSTPTGVSRKRRLPSGAGGFAHGLGNGNGNGDRTPDSHSPKSATRGSISSLLNPTQQMHQAPSRPGPSASGGGCYSREGSPARGGPERGAYPAPMFLRESLAAESFNGKRENRRAQLREELEELKERLRRKEMELQEVGDDR